jgi:NAD dependent epimerase/dehydratase
VLDFIILRKKAMTKVFVTGADGFIGSHLVESLVTHGHDVRAFVQYNSLNSWGWLDDISPCMKRQIEVVAGDIRDQEQLMRSVLHCDVVFHLAALIAIPYSYQAPSAFVATNMMGTLNVLNAAREANVDLFIQTSTSEVYGSAQFVPITEEHPLVGQSPYSASKIGADQMAIAYHRSFEVPVCVLRPFNTYGPRQSARAIIPTIITQILQGKKEIELGTLAPTRDFNYVQDTVNGFLSVLGNQKVIGEVINIGSNFEISIEETVNTIKHVMGSDVEVVTSARRIRPQNSEVDRLFSSNEKAKRLLGWSPEYAGREGFSQGVQNTVNWFKNNNNIQHYREKGYVI